MTTGRSVALLLRLEVAALRSVPAVLFAAFGAGATVWMAWFFAPLVPFLPKLPWKWQLFMLATTLPVLAVVGAVAGARRRGSSVPLRRGGRPPWPLLPANRSSEVIAAVVASAAWSAAAIAVAGALGRLDWLGQTRFSVSFAHAVVRVIAFACLTMPFVALGAAAPSFIPRERRKTAVQAALLAITALAVRAPPPAFVPFAEIVAGVVATSLIAWRADALCAWLSVPSTTRVRAPTVREIGPLGAAPAPSPVRAVLHLTLANTRARVAGPLVLTVLSIALLGTRASVLGGAFACFALLLAGIGALASPLATRPELLHRLPVRRAAAVATVGAVTAIWFTVLASAITFSIQRASALLFHRSIGLVAVGASMPLVVAALLCLLAANFSARRPIQIAAGIAGGVAVVYANVHALIPLTAAFASRPLRVAGAPDVASVLLVGVVAIVVGVGALAVAARESPRAR